MDDAEGGAGLGRVVGEAVVVGLGEFFADRKAHEGVAVGGGEVDLVFQDLLDDEADVLGRHGGAADEDALEAGLHEGHALGEVLEEARGGEHVGDLAVAQDRGGLVDDVLLILAGHGHVAHADEALHEARVEVDEVAGVAAVVREMLHGEAQAAGAGGADHQPIALGEKVGPVVVAVFFVVGLVVIPADALLGHAGGAAGLEHVVGALGIGLGDEAFGLLGAQHIVVEVGEFFRDVGEALDFLARIPAGGLGPLEPVVAAGGGREVPRDHLAGPGVEGGLGLGRGEFAAHDVLIGKNLARQ